MNTHMKSCESVILLGKEASLLGIYIPVFGKRSVSPAPFLSRKILSWRPRLVFYPLKFPALTTKRGRSTQEALIHF